MSVRSLPSAVCIVFTVVFTVVVAIIVTVVTTTFIFCDVVNRCPQV